MRRSTLPLIGAMLAALSAIGVTALVLWHQLAPGNGRDGVRSASEAVIAPGISIGGPFQLVDHTGQPISDEAFRGQYMLVYFGFTFCPDVCPTELASMAAALDIVAEANPEIAEKITPILVSIDPARDTPDAMAQYVKAFHPRFVGLTGSAEAIADAARKYRVFYARGQDLGEGQYLMTHSSFIYFMGDDGSFQTMFNGGSAPEDIAEALSRYAGAGSTS